MSRLDYKLYYERHLPHVQPAGATFLITARLKGSLPRSVIESLDAEARKREMEIAEIADQAKRDHLYSLAQRQLFARYDAALDHTTQDPFWLLQTEAAQQMATSLHFLAGKHYDLLAYTIMGNHIHFVCTPLQDKNSAPISLSRIGHSLKSYTAHKINSILGRSGGFWQQESHDHFARDQDEVGRIVLYVLQNPVKAGLVEHWDGWPWTYVRDLPG